MRMTGAGCRGFDGFVDQAYRDAEKRCEFFPRRLADKLTNPAPSIVQNRLSLSCQILSGRAKIDLDTTDYKSLMDS
jgi:hypothetical protein